MPGSDGGTVFLRTTFGVLVSRDAGRHWRWICERALGYDGQWDPPIAVTRDGRLWVGLDGGLRVTTDGCAVTTIPELEGETIRDLTVDAKGDFVWAISSAPGKDAHVWRGAAGQSFVRLATLPDTNLMTIEVSPSNPSRVYVSGQRYGTIRGQIFRSDDAGKTFATAKNDEKADGPFFIAALDPADDKRILVRHLHANGSELLLSVDAGKTWRNVLSMASAMYGFAKSPDGKTLYAGSGLPEHGVYRSTDRGEHFSRVSQSGVLCLHASAAGLFVCQNALTPGAPSVGVSRDEGASVTSLATFADIEGPIGCADGPVADAGGAICGASWAETRALFVGVDGGPDADAGRRPRKRVDAGASATPDGRPPARSCACHVVGGVRGADRARIIEGLLPLGLWAASRVRRRRARSRLG